MKICRKISFLDTLIRRKLQTVSVQVTTLRALNDFWFVFTTALGTAGHQAPGHTPAPAITRVRNSGERSQRGFTQFEGFEL